MDTINLNNSILFTKDFENGKTTILVKAGRKTFALDIDKNASSITISKYNYSVNGSKYDINADLKAITIKNTNTMIDRKFIDSFDILAESYNTLRTFGFDVQLIK